MIELKEIVEVRLRELELGPVEAATAAGIERTFIRDIVEGKKKNVRADKVGDLARALKLDAAALARKEFVRLDELKVAGVREVVVMASVQAGAWSESWEWEYDDRYSVMVPDYPEYRQFRLYAAEARGTSMNRRYIEGTVLIFVNVHDTKEEPIPGKRYIVERKRVSGETEHTVKMLHADAEGKLWLMPESDDPRFQAAISVDEGTDDGDIVVIVGRVIAAVIKE